MSVQSHLEKADEILGPLYGELLLSGLAPNAPVARKFAAGLTHLRAAEHEAATGQPVIVREAEL